jgi:hypothetical protein
MTYASVNQSTKMLTTVPEPRTSVDAKQGARRSDDDDRAHHGQPDEPGDKRRTIDPYQRREQDLVDRRRDDPRESDPNAIPDLRGGLDCPRVRGVPGVDQRHRGNEPHDRGSSDAPVES